MGYKLTLAKWDCYGMQMFQTDLSRCRNTQPVNAGLVCAIIQDVPVVGKWKTSGMNIRPIRAGYIARVLKHISFPPLTAVVNLDPVCAEKFNVIDSRIATRAHEKACYCERDCEKNFMGRFSW